MPATPYALIASLPAAILLWCLWRRREVPGARPLIAHTILSGFWLLAYAFQLDSPDVATALTWRKIKYLGVVATPAAWFVFTIHYAGFAHALTRGRLAAIGIVPAATFLLSVTNERHQLLWVGEPASVAEVGTMRSAPRSARSWSSPTRCSFSGPSCCCGP